jgi:RNA polymerase sigma-70 factor (ECF subfamily)
MIVASPTRASSETPLPAAGVAPPRPTFAELYELHLPFVWRTARRLGAPEASVDDVTQEIFIIVHRRYPEFDGRWPVRTWLFAIIRNVVRAHRRTLQRKNPHTLRADVSSSAAEIEDVRAGEQVAAKREASRLVHLLLEELDDDKRAVFVLAELEQMSAPEIAAAIGIPMNTVYSRLRLAREAFAAAAARHRARDDWRSK